jgi:hypothetical protein
MGGSILICFVIVISIPFLMSVVNIHLWGLVFGKYMSSVCRESL